MKATSQAAEDLPVSNSQKIHEISKFVILGEDIVKFSEICF